jgi:hypothetical protein
LDT